MAEEKMQSQDGTITEKGLKDTIEDVVPLRDPKLEEQDLMNTIERSKVPLEGDTHESIVSVPDVEATSQTLAKK